MPRKMPAVSLLQAAILWRFIVNSGSLFVFNLRFTQLRAKYPAYKD